jgi:hypothetical protein
LTCIAGLVGKDGCVYIGGDSAGVAGWSITPRSDLKVFRRGEWVFGFTSSFRMGQLIRYALTLPKVPDRDLDRFMCTTFVDALRQTMKNGGLAKIEHGVETGGTFLVGIRGRLFQVGDDFQVGESRLGFEAVGCGQDEARGAARFRLANRCCSHLRRPLSRTALSARHSRWCQHDHDR